MPSGEGDSVAASQTEVYAEMHKIAAIHLSRSGRGGGTPTIQPTALVHEAWLRLSGRASWKSKTHFLALASRTMRMIMIDAARARLAQKRGGVDVQRVHWSPEIEFGEPRQAVPLDQVIEIDRVLTQLAGRDQRKARVVEMRFFGGLDFEEIADALDVSVPTAKRDWEFARAWLFSRLGGADGAGGAAPSTGASPGSGGA